MAEYHDKADKAHLDAFIQCDKAVGDIHRMIVELNGKKPCSPTILDIINKLEDSKNMQETLQNIMEGFSFFDAKASIICFLESDKIRVAGLYPQIISNDFESILGVGPGGYLVPEKNGNNPFYNCIESGSALLYHGEEQLLSFFSLCFPGIGAVKIAKSVSLFFNLSLMVLPLKTSGRVRGAIALAAEAECLKDNFENHFIIAKLAADSIDRQFAHIRNSSLESRYRKLIENANELIILCSYEGNIIYINHPLRGESSNAQVANVFDFFNGENRKKLMAVFKALQTSDEPPEPLELQIKGPRGESLWSEIVIRRFNEGSDAVQFEAHDITLRKKMELEVESLSSFQREIFHNEFIGIVTVKLDGKVCSWNTGASHILGFEEREIMGMLITDLAADESHREFKKLLKDCVRKNTQMSASLKLRIRGGGAAVVTMIMSVIGETDRPMSVIIVFFDISERVRLEIESRELVSELAQAQQMTILTLTKLTEYRDIETGTHLERIMKYTELLATRLAGTKAYDKYVTQNYINDLVMSAPLHDIGKVGIPDYILHKPGRFTPQEYEIMKRHTTIGGNSIREAERHVSGRSFLNLGKEVVYYHHERWDGKGYPDGLKGDDIPLSARIVALADVYDALTTKRPYKEAFAHNDAAAIIAENANTHFDHRIVGAFLDMADEFNRWKDYYS
jgi:PAS domain S-box-containing protein